MYSSFDLDVVRKHIKDENDYEEFMNMSRCIYDFRYDCTSRVHRYVKYVNLLPTYFQNVEEDDTYSCLILLELCQVIGPVNLTDSNIVSLIRRGALVVPEKL